MHENWSETHLLQRMKELAEQRNLKDMTIGPILTVTDEEVLSHIEQLKSIDGVEVLWGGEKLEGHQIPDFYGAIHPTAVKVPLRQLLKPENFSTVTKEIFGPFQIICEYAHDELPQVLEACERMENHLTAAVVSKDISFMHKVLQNTVNGTSYMGIRARTTGAPQVFIDMTIYVYDYLALSSSVYAWQNHWFGPAGDPRGAGIGSPEAIKLVWSCHREIISDNLVPEGIDAKALQQT